MNKDMPLDLEQCIDFHGHLCPGIIIGYKVAKIAMEKMKFKKARDDEVVCVSMSDGCAVDAIQYLTRCTLGKGNLIFQDYGKMVFLFLKRKKGSSGTGVRISLQSTSRWKKLRRSKHTSKEKAALDLLKIVEDKLFKIEKLKDYPIPRKARIFPSQKCESCGELTMEPRLKVCDGKLLCPECAPGDYSRGW
jgi:formylmethanofuran dehydrogenase subunit E